MKTSLPSTIVAICVCTCFVISATTADPLSGFCPLAEAQDSLDETTAVDFSDAEELSKEVKRLGARLIKIVADDKQPPESRVKAARLLGELKFAPAIPTLINNISLVDRSLDGISGSEGDPLVCLIALQSFGNAAVPQIVDAYLDEPDPIKNVSRNEDIRRHLLLAAIGGGSTSRVATTHYLGLSARKDKRITPAKTKEWNQYLGQ